MVFRDIHYLLKIQSSFYTHKIRNITEFETTTEAHQDKPKCKYLLVLKILIKTNIFIIFQINNRGGGAASRAAENVGCAVVQAARDRRSGAADSRPGRGQLAPHVVEYKTVVRIKHPEGTLSRWK